VRSTACAHCGLPRGRHPVARRFCCYGCLLAFQVTRARGERGAAAAIFVRLGLALFFAMNVMMLSLPTYAPVVYGAASGDGPLFVVLRVLALVFAAPVLLLLGGPILATAWQGLRAGAPNADGLIILGTLAAYALSVANTVRGRSAVYFDTAAMLLVLVTLGRWLEARARAEAGALVRATLAPAPARALRLRGATREPVRPGALVPGDVVEVAPGAAFPTDGEVLAGTGGVDESALTGESRPVTKVPGAAVAGGTCSVDAVFRVRVTAPVRESAAARIAGLVAAAHGERSPAERLADAVARRMTPAVVAIALVAGGWWGWHAGAERGVLVALSVLVVACPCALGIATPVAVWTGLATAARRGVIVRAAPLLERAAAVEYVLFDKTGTLTDARPRLHAVEPVPGVTEDDVLAHAAALEAGLGHPLARAITLAAEGRGLAVAAASEVRVAAGAGVRGVVAGERAAVGTARLAAAETGLALEEGGAGGGMRVAVTAGERLLGTLAFAETARPDAQPALAACRRLGLRVGLVSGDVRADAVVPALVPAADAALGLLPADKVAHVRAARARATVAMVGDGINDAPALAAADLGIAVASATDLARLSADVVIVGDDLARVPWLFAHARRVARVVRQNLLWAFAYNVGAVALAAAGRLDPLVASAAMLGSSLLVVANARRLRPLPE
jgi:heavy metal translocating P-type ATPase